MIKHLFDGELVASKHLPFGQLSVPINVYLSGLEEPQMNDEDSTAVLTERIPSPLLLNRT